MKKVPEKLKNILKEPFVKTLINRSQDVDYETLVKSLIPDIFSKNPTTVCDAEGNYTGTTLDLQSAMYNFMSRNAVINISKYHAMRGTVLKDGQHLVSKENRHGKVVGLSCAKDLWSFGMRIVDVNIMKFDDTGDFRVFNVVGVDGEWYEGWERIEFMPTAKENEFFIKLASNGKITFNNFIAPQRRFNIFSSNYFVIKIALARLEDEIQYLGGLIKLMNDKGIVLPPEEKKEWPETTKLGNEKKIKIKSVTYEVDIPPLVGEYAMMPLNQDTLVEVVKRKKWLTYKIKSQLQFYIRGEEYANFRYANPDKPFPHWMKGVEWKEYKSPKKFTVNANFLKKFDGNERSILNLMKERSYKENEKNQFYAEYEFLNKLLFGISEIPDSVRDKVKFSKGRTKYERLLIFQPDVGMYGISLLKKEFEKTETVNENYNV